jgi:AAA domain/Transcriptional regulator, AbiEi antitoxin
VTTDDGNPLHYEPGVDYEPQGLDLLAGLRNGAWLDGQEFPPMRYAVEPVVPEGSVLLAGAPKIGKSWLVLGLALGCAYGGRALGIKAERRRVLYLALEDGDRRMQDRCRKLLHDEPIPREFEYLTRVAGPSYVLDTIGVWVEHGQHDDPPLVILDTLGKVMPAAAYGETPYQRDYRIGSELKTISDKHPGMTMLTNHHDRKAAADDFVDTVSGSHGLAGAADALIVIARPRNEPAGVLKVTGRDVPEAEYAVVFDGAGWSIDGRDVQEAARKAAQIRLTEKLGENSIEIINFAAEHPDGVRAKDVAEFLGVDDKVARTYLARLAENGRLKRAERGLYVSVASVASVATAGQKPAETQQPTQQVLRSDEAVTSENHTRNTSNTDSSVCRRCGQRLMHPKSIERGTCARCEEGQPP